MRYMDMEKVVKIVKRNEQETDFGFWSNQPYEKRIETLEEIRKEFHNGLIPGFQRVYRIVKRSQG